MLHIMSKEWLVTSTAAPTVVEEKKVAAKTLSVQSMASTDSLNNPPTPPARYSPSPSPSHGAHPPHPPSLHSVSSDLHTTVLPAMSTGQPSTPPNADKGGRIVRPPNASTNTTANNSGKRSDSRPRSALRGSNSNDNAATSKNRSTTPNRVTRTSTTAASSTRSTTPHRVTASH